MGESENIELIVDPSLSGMRLDAYLREQTPFSRSRIASLMEEGALLVNGEIAVDHGVHTGARPGKTIRD